MWEYRIVKTDVGFSIYRKKEKDGFLSLRFLDGNNKWVLNKQSAKVYYHKEDAIGALTLAKFKGEREEKTDTASENQTNSLDKQEKKSWSEF